MKHLYKFLKLVICSMLFCLLWCCTGGERKEVREYRETRKSFVDTLSAVNLQKLIDLIRNDSSSLAEIKEFSLLNKNSTIEDTIKSIADEAGLSYRTLYDVYYFNKDIDLKANLFLESSGSMFGYETPEIGDFKNALSDVFIKIDKGNGDIYIVNDGIYSFDGSFSEFIKGGDFYKTLRKDTSNKYGDTGNTRFDKIFPLIFSATKKNDISILASDLIVSDQLGKTDSQAIINDTKSMIQRLFGANGDADKFSLLIMKFDGGFKGAYYAFDNTVYRPKEKINRPFYLSIIARNETMNYLLKSKKYKDFRKFDNLPNYKEYIYFSKIDSFLVPEYTVALDEFTEKRIRQAKNETQRLVPYIRELVLEQKQKMALSFNVNVNLSHFFLADSYLRNKDNYEATSGFSITSVEDNIDSRGYTHTLTLACPEKTLKAPTDIVVSLKKSKDLPDWVARSTSTDDRNFADTTFYQTTFGLKEFLSGLQNAYHTDNEQFYKFKIKIKKK